MDLSTRSNELTFREPKHLELLSTCVSELLVCEKLSRLMVHIIFTVTYFQQRVFKLIIIHLCRRFFLFYVSNAVFGLATLIFNGLEIAMHSTMVINLFVYTLESKIV